MFESASSPATVIASIVCLALVAASGCGPEKNEESQADSGAEEIFRTPADNGNTFACSTCHALEAPARDGYRKPGHPLVDAAARPTYKNGKLDSLLAAVNSCREEWMLAERWSESDEQWKRLKGWLEKKAPDKEVEPLSFQIVEPPADLSGGDAGAGRRVFNDSCAGCHGEDAQGTNKAPNLVEVELDAETIGRRVRTSGLSDSSVYEGLTGGRMPFWAKDRLSDDELRDMVAYLADDVGSTGDAGLADVGVDATSDAGSNGDATDRADSTVTLPDVGNCASTHRKVGWTATLETKAHNVGGTAKIVDDCTVVIDNFTYDGGGITVEVYGTDAVSNGTPNFSKGYAISEDIYGRSFDGERFVMTLPQGKSLDELDALSVWCSDVGADFGSGTFSK